MQATKQSGFFECFSPIIGVTLGSIVSSVIRMEITPRDANSARMLRSHRIYFVWWTAKHRVFESLFSMISESVTGEALNMLMACFAQSLMTGHSVMSKCVRADTAAKYVLAAATFLEYFDTVPNRDARRRYVLEKGCAPASQNGY